MKNNKVIKNTISFNITIYFLFLVIICISASLISIYYHTYKINKRHKMETTVILLDNIRETIDSKIKTMERTSKVLLGNHKVNNSLKELQNNTSLSFYKKTELIDTIKLNTIFAFTTLDQFSITYYGQNGLLLVNDIEYSRNKNNMFFGMEQQVIQDIKNKKRRILSPREHGIIGDNGQKPILYIRGMESIENKDFGAYLVLMIDPKFLGTYLEKTSKIISNSEQAICSLYMLDKDKYIIASSNQLKSTGFVKKNGYRYIEVFSDYTGFTTVIELPNKYFSIDLFKLTTTTTSRLMIILIFSSLLLFYLLRKKLSVLSKLVRAIDEIRNGNYGVELDVNNLNYDIELVFRGFNNMVREIDTLVNKVYASKLMAQSAQLKMLEYQINPHFLYNSLQTLEAIGEIHGVESIQNISASIGSILRYNLKSSTMVYLNEEISNVKKYIGIESIRFDKNVEIIMNIDDSMNKYKIIKFTLQPIVENCFQHGFSNITKKGLIIIEGKKTNNKLILSIKDNGKGIEPDELTEIKEALKTNHAIANNLVEDHIGLKNIDVRMKTYYGEEYGILIESQLGKGTEVTMKFRLQKGGKECIK